MKKRGRNPKELPFKWAEALALILIGISFLFLFQMERDRYQIIESNYQNNMRRSVYGDGNEYFGDTDMTEEEVRDNLLNIMDYIPTFTRADKTSRGTSRIGFAAGFYDAEGNVIVETKPRNIIIKYDDITEDGKYARKWLNLEDYFLEPEVDQFIEHCQHSGMVLDIVYMDGYYEPDGEFVVVELGYDLEKDGEVMQSYAIHSGADVSDKQLVRRENTPEDGNLYLEVYNEKASQNEKALELLRETYGYEDNWQRETSQEFAYGGGGSLDLHSMIATVSGGGVYGIVVYYVPLFKITITSFALWRKFAFLAAVIQIGMLIIYVLYREIMEKQRELDHMRNTFINAMAHEMKTPAAVIKNGTECIKDGINPEKNQHYLDMISYEADHLNDLLSKMLLYTRTSEGVYALHKENISLVKLVNGVIQSYQLAMEFKGVTLEIKTEKPKEVCADEMLLKMVIDNFISNGIRYGNEDGKMIITVEGKSVSVYNEGKSLSLEEQKRIWEPLYVIDKARSETDGSAGMGLAICKNILELHDAKYGVENVDDGVRFYFTLP